MLLWISGQGQISGHKLMGCVLWVWITLDYLGIFIPDWHRKPFTYLVQTTQVWPSWVWGYAKSGGTAGQKWCCGRGQWKMRSTGGSSCKTTPGKFAMARVPLEVICVLPKLEPGQLPICLNHTSLWWCGEGHIDTEEKYFIAVDMDSGYWKLATEEEAWERMELLSPDRKIRWKLILIGYLNEAPTFVLMKLQIEWDKLAKEHGLKMFHQKWFLMMC